MVKVLFVCMGNLCRSPTAQGVFEAIVERNGLTKAFLIDSAGTGGWHVGSKPDARSTTAAKNRGYDIGKQKARQIKPKDFGKFDHILVMDNANFRDVMEQCPVEEQHKIRLLLDYSMQTDYSSVPDPYYGGAGGFTLVLDLIEDAARGLLDELVREHGLG